MKEILLKIFHAVGLDIKRYPARDLRRRQNLMSHYKINKVIDVGAFNGSYALELRELGYRGNIVSFEPRLKSYEEMQVKSNKDNRWETINAALGNEDGEAEINIAGNEASSSMLEMKDIHFDSAPESAYVGTEKIKISKLDSVFDEICEVGDNILLKIDTQGFEKSVLDGAINSLPNITGLQLEMSLVNLYDGEILYFEMINFLLKHGFELCSIENGFFDEESGRLFQFDGVVYKHKK